MFKQWFDKVRAQVETKSGGDDVSNLQAAISSRLPSLAEAEINYLTATVGLMTDVAHSDLDIAVSERDYMVKVLTTMTSLPEDQCQMLVDISLDENIVASSGNLHGYIRMLNDFASAQQKEELLHVLFGLAAADGVVESSEEQAIKLIAHALHIRQRQFAEIRLHFSDKRTVLLSLSREI